MEDYKSKLISRLASNDAMIGIIGLGGHCIPIDPLYLSWKLRSKVYLGSDFGKSA